MAGKRSQEKDQQIIAMFLAGMNQREIAKQVGCHYNTVCRILKRPEVQAVMRQTGPQVEETIAAETQQAVKSLHERFDEAAEVAFEKVQNLMEGAQSESVQLKASESILDRASNARKRVLHAQHDVNRHVIQLTLSGDEIMRMHQGALELGEDIPLPQLPPGGATVLLDGETGEVLGDGELHDGRLYDGP